MNIEEKAKKIIYSKALLESILRFSHLTDVYDIYGGEKEFLKDLENVSDVFEKLLSEITSNNNGDESKTMDDFEKLNVTLLKSLLKEILEEK